MLAGVDEVARACGLESATNTVEGWRHLRRMVLTKPQNISILLEITAGKVDSDVVFLALDLICELVEKYNASLQLTDILKALMSSDVRKEVLSRLSDCVVIVLRYLCLLSDEDSVFALEIPKTDVVSGLQERVFCGFMDSFPEIIESFEEEDSEFMSEFRGYVVDVLQWSRRCMSESPEGSLQIMCSCLGFGGVDDWDVPSCDKVAQIFADVSVFEFLYFMAREKTAPISDSAFKIVGLLAKVSQTMSSHVQNLIVSIRVFVSHVINSFGDFTSDRTKCVAFGKVMSLMPVQWCDYEQGLFGDMLFGFAVSLISSMDRSSVMILPGLLSVLVHEMRIVNMNGNEERYFALRDRMSSLFKLFLESSVAFFRGEGDVTTSCLGDRATVIALVKGLWEVSDAPENAVVDVARFIVGTINQASRSLSDVERRGLVGLMTDTVTMLLSHKKTCVDDATVALFVDTCTGMMSSSLFSIGDREALGMTHLDLVDVFISRCFDGDGDNFSDIRPLLTVMRGEVDIANFIFNYLLENIDNDIHVERSSRVLLHSITCPALKSCILTMEWRRRLVSAWMKVAPCQSLSAVMTRCFFARSRDIAHEFIEAFKSRYPSGSDVFRPMACLFMVASRTGEWMRLCEMFLDMYGDMATQVSMSDSYSHVLEFLVIFSRSIRQCQKSRRGLRLDTTSRYSFSIVRLVTKLLHNCCDRVSGTVAGIAVPSSVFTWPLTKRNCSRTLEGSENPGWRQLTALWKCTCILFSSPFTVMDILAIYGDMCIPILLDSLIVCTSRTSIVSLLSVDGIVRNINKCISVFLNCGQYSLLITNVVRRDFTLDVARVGFLSQEPCVVAAVCRNCCHMCEFLSVNDIGLLWRHFVLALNIVLNVANVHAEHFVYQYIARNTGNLGDLSGLSGLIVSDLDSSGAKRAFERNWISLTVITVDEETYTKRLQSTRADLAPYLIELDCLPGLSHIFAFT